MSVFRVKLNNNDQGKLDIDPTTGLQFTTSKQRTIYLQGPNRISRQLKDGDVFSDCNYYKKFVYPNVPLSQAILEIVSDDGSVWSENPEENTFPKVYNLTLEADSTYTDEDNIIDIVGTTGGYAKFAQITNNGGNDINVKLNGSDDAILVVPDGATQTFNNGDLIISKIEFDNSDSGASSASVQVIVSIESVCKS